MKCPPEIAEVLLDILTTAILRIRAMGCSEHTFMEADHIHNLPALIQHYSPELLKFYWEVERPSFVRQCSSASHFDPLWERLRQVGNLKDSTLPTQQGIPATVSPLPR